VRSLVCEVGCAVTEYREAQMQGGKLWECEMLKKSRKLSSLAQNVCATVYLSDVLGSDFAY
jgi:hypothetical protein